jgi:hypothetical protein
LYEFLDAFIDGPGETKHRRLQVFLTAFESMEDQKRLLVEFVTKSVLSWGKKHGYKKVPSVINAVFNDRKDKRLTI